MRGAQDFRPRELVAGRVQPGVEAEISEADRLIQRHPMLHPVGQLIHHHLHIIGEPIRRIPVEPAAPMIQRQRIIPVKQRHIRRNAGPEQFINQLVVERQPLRVDLAGAGGNHARPRHGKPVGVRAQRLHHGHVLLVTPVMVARLRAGMPAPHRARLAAEHVPDRLPSPVGFC